MARLYDRLLAHPVTQRAMRTPSPAVSWGNIRFNRLSEAVVIDATNVADYLYLHMPKQTDEDFATITHNIAPLSEVVWWEARSTAVSRGYLGRTVEGWGELQIASDLWAACPHKDPAQRDAWVRRVLTEIRDREAADLKPESAAHLIARLTPPPGIEVRWAVYGWQFVEVRGGLDPSPFAVNLHFVAADGSQVRNATGGFAGMSILAGTVQSDEERERITLLLESMHWPFLLATTFAHCKNVTLTQAPPPPAKVARKWEKRHGRSMTTFHTLSIVPFQETLRTQGRIGEVGFRKAMHLCRGHFATYTEERPLFGRLTGTFFRPAHIRGAAEAGLVQKDYRVEQSRDGRAA